jgi:DNA-directed RNA polymerase specialized sigma24 family protein
VARLCRRLLGPTPEAQDIAQEAALQAFLRLGELQDAGRFGAWLHAIAANLARMELRRRRTLSLDTLPDGAAMIVLWEPARTRLRRCMPRASCPIRSWQR